MKICIFSAGSEKSFIEMILSLVFQLIGKKLFHLCFVDEEQFLKLDNGLFDPDQWNPVYWRSFENLLK